MTITAATVTPLAELVAELARQSACVVRKRTEVRFFLESELTLLLRTASGEWRPLGPAWGCDMSYRGLGLLVTQELLPGKMLRVDLSAAAKRPLHVGIRVVYCRQLVPGIYRLGALFVDDAGNERDARELRDAPSAPGSGVMPAAAEPLSPMMSPT